MIKVYIQYSYGGFNTFHIKCEENESVSSEVTISEPHEFPSEAQTFFRNGGVKLLYKFIGEDKLDLIVKEIPSPHKDGSGNPIPCAVQFIGQKKDRKTLDSMVVEILSKNITDFDEWFSKLFFVNDGLRIKGDILSGWIKGHEKQNSTTQNYEELAHTRDISSGDIIVVPLSEKFGVDSGVTNRVAVPLDINLNISKDCIIYLSDLPCRLKSKADVPCEVSEDSPIESDYNQDSRPAKDAKSESVDKDLQNRLEEKSNEDSKTSCLVIVKASERNVKVCEYCHELVDCFKKLLDFIISQWELIKNRTIKEVKKMSENKRTNNKRECKNNIATKSRKKSMVEKEKELVH